MNELPPPPQIPPPGEKPPPNEPPKEPGKFWLWRFTGAIGNIIRVRLGLGIALEKVPDQAGSEKPDMTNAEKLEQQLIRGGSTPERAAQIAKIATQPETPRLPRGKKLKPEEPPKNASAEPPESTLEPSDTTPETPPDT